MVSQIVNNFFSNILLKKFGYVLKVELTGYADELDRNVKKGKELRITTVFGLSIWKDLPNQVLEKKIRSLVSDILSF